MVKILDKYLVQIFLPSMIMASFIAVFVLAMQQLWLYLDEIMGKGVSFWDISEMFIYMSISFLPMGMPIGILIASVMLFGNLGERYELAGIKSAGVSLFRIMAPLVVASIGLAVFSFYCSNNLIPYANLKSKTLLYDIRKQKPALNLREEVYNYDFKGYAIKIGKKYPNGQDLEDVLIYDHSRTRRNEVSVITAKTGKMYTTPDERYLVMELHDGHQYQEVKDSYANRTYPVMRSDFETYVKTFDLTEFGLTRTNTELFEQHEMMLNISQLSQMIDSMEIKTAEIKAENVKGFSIDRDTVKLQKNLDDDLVAQVTENMQIDNYTENTTFLNRFKEKHKDNLISRAIGKVRYYESRAESYKRSIDKNTIKIAKFQYQKHNKFSLAVVCIIFLFIGAPMGAIVRKGGIGYPMLIAIIFFMLFIVLTMFSKNMVDKALLNALLGAWLPCLVLFPIGVFLTIKARNDSKFINVDRIIAFFQKIFSRKSKLIVDEAETR